MTKYYFAYGSNLNKEQMKFRCPKAVAMGGLELPKAQLVFNGVADVVFHKTKTAVGGLYRITDECEAALDRYEGVAGYKGRGAYRKETIKVIVTEKGVERVADALIYVMNRDNRRMPTVSYLNTIKQGFADFGLDQSFLNRALLDTKKEAAAQAAREITEREARWAKEDAERRDRGRNLVPAHYSFPRDPFKQPSPHKGITDTFDDPIGDLFNDEVNSLYRDFDSEAIRNMDREISDEEAESNTYAMMENEPIRDIPPRQSQTVRKVHDKSAKGSNIPSAKSPHLFPETPRHQRARR
jgi:gamma-glutamylcyclotransferase (GGCT)/AIG2-like uncharacterized protein YtfP